VGHERGAGFKFNLIHLSQFLSDTEGSFLEEVHARNHSVISIQSLTANRTLLDGCGAEQSFMLEKTISTARVVYEKRFQTASINRYYRHCLRIMSGYPDGLGYGTRELTENVCTYIHTYTYIRVNIRVNGSP
jgi:hypothetical protein